MAIPSKQIGWGTEENLLWQISKQLENLTKVAGNIGKTSTTSTTSTTTTAAPMPNMSLTVTNNANLFDIAQNSDFTIEWFMYLGADDNHPRMYSFGSYFSGGASHAVSIENGTFYWWVNGSIIISTGVSILNGWHHFCLQRFANTTTLYIDGATQTNTSYSNAIPTAAKPLYIGSEGDDSLASALFSNFRWNSTQAIYSPPGFAPPSAPLSTNSGTTLLLFQGTNLGDELVDYSGYMNVVTNGTGSYNADNPFAGYQGCIVFGF